MSNAGRVAPPQPSPSGELLTIDACRRHIADTCGLPSPAPTVGAEVEWLVVDASDPRLRPSVDDLRGLLEGLEMPAGSRITFEPGGQLELSGPPGRSAEEAVAPIAADVGRVREALASRNWRLEPRACDPHREPQRVNGLARYGEMERWFAEGGWNSAPEMMCNTAAVQVNLGCGPDPALTWKRANRMAAPLAAAFAASPGGGWASSRLRAWAGLDPSRTRSAFASGDPVGDWATYALSALAMLRQDGADVVRLPCRVSFAEWVEGKDSFGIAPSQADFELHLSTLFPPVRLKGWLELRVFDMPCGEDWPVPVAVAAALLSGPEVEDEGALLERVEHLDWTEAARLGLRPGPLRDVALTLVSAAVERLEAGESPLTDSVRRWAQEST